MPVLQFFFVHPVGVSSLRVSGHAADGLLQTAQGRRFVGRGIAVWSMVYNIIFFISKNNNNKEEDIAQQKQGVEIADRTRTDDPLKSLEQQREIRLARPPWAEILS